MQSDHTRENRGRSRNLLEFLQLVQFLVHSLVQMLHLVHFLYSVHHQRLVAAVKPLIAAALILTQGTKRTLTGPHFSEISSVLFEAQLSADSWL